MTSRHRFHAGTVCRVSGTDVAACFVQLVHFVHFVHPDDLVDCRSLEVPMPQTHRTNVPDSEAVMAAATAEALETHAKDATALRMQITQPSREVTTLDIPASAVPLIAAVLRELGAGRAVTVLGDDAEITTQEAADLLNVSRPYLVGLIESGHLPARKVGPRRRLLLADVLTYRTETKARRREALRDLAALDQELGLR